LSRHHSWETFADFDHQRFSMRVKKATALVKVQSPLDPQNVTEDCGRL
jgi:hypothetical protein